MNNGGDVLARGGKSAVFGPAKVSQEKWDAIFSDSGIDFDKQDETKKSEPISDKE